MQKASAGENGGKMGEQDRGTGNKMGRGGGSSSTSEVIEMEGGDGGMGEVTRSLN